MSATHDLTMFIYGLLAAGYAVAALYFLKFWRQTRDRLFAFFAASFALLFVQRTALATDLIADAHWYYWSAFWPSCSSSLPSWTRTARDPAEPCLKQAS